jgi:hypothetical protein
LQVGTVGGEDGRLQAFLNDGAVKIVGLVEYAHRPALLYRFKKIQFLAHLFLLTFFDW